MAKLPERDLQILWNRLKDVYEYFKSRGIPDKIIAGILGNAGREGSGFWDNVTSSIKDKEGKIQYFYGGVLNELATYDWVNTNYGGYTKQHQIQYIADGVLGKLPEIKSDRGRLLNSRFRRFMSKASKSNSPSEIAAYWESIYEIAGKSKLDERLQCAEYFYKLMQKSNSRTKSSNKLNKSKSLPDWANPDFSKVRLPTKGLYYNFTSENTDLEYPTYNLDNVKTEFDLPIYASTFKNGGKLIKKGQLGVTLRKTIHLKKDGNEPKSPHSELKSWFAGITPEERMDLTTKLLNELVSTYLPTKELQLASYGIKHPFSWGEAVPALAPIVVPTVIATGPEIGTALINPAFWGNLIKDTALYTAADVASEGITGKGIGAHVNNAIGLPEEEHPVGKAIGFIGTSFLRKPLEEGIVSAYKGLRGTILPEYALSLAMNESLWKPYVSRIVQENGKIRLRLPSHTDATPREVVLEPQGNNKFYVHVRTWDGEKIPANLSERDKGYLYEALYNELPEGAEILFPESGPGNYATRGTVAGLLKLGRDPRFSRGSPGTLQYTDKDGLIKEFTGTSFIKKPITPSQVITYKEPSYSLYYKNTFNFPRLEQYNYGVLPIKDTAIRPLQHLLDKQALLMFKEYGGIKIPDELPIKNELLLYAKEARVRYGLEGNTEITDLEIAEALYKHLIENNVVTYPGWGPLVGFRGTTSRANYLRSTINPIEYATRAASGSMDNSLGKLFLGRLPFSNPVKGSFWNKGVDRYLYVARPISSDNPNFFDLRLEGAGQIDITPQFFVNIPEQVPIDLINKDFFNKYFLYSLGNFKDASGAYKVRPEYTKKGINDLNAYMFRTPAYRDITNEMSVANWNSTIYPENNFLWLTKEKPIINPDGISGTYKGQEVIFMDSGLESDPGLRRLIGDLYLAIHENAIKNNLGLYISRPSVFRQEHKYYPYIALPQWNLINAKHILPYDLRLPRLWGDPNVYLKTGGKLVKRIKN